MSRQYFYWRVISEGEARANRQLILTLSSHTNIRQRLHFGCLRIAAHYRCAAIRLLPSEVKSQTNPYFVRLVLLPL